MCVFVCVCVVCICVSGVFVHDIHQEAIRLLSNGHLVGSFFCLLTPQSAEKELQHCAHDLRGVFGNGCSLT